MTIKEIIDEVLAQSGFLKRQSYFSENADVDDQQMTAIANRAMLEIRDHFPWPALRKSGNILMDSNFTRYALPEDLKSIVPMSMYQGSGNRQANFPPTDDEFYALTMSERGDTGGTITVKKIGNELDVPYPKDGDSVQFQYMSRYAVVDENGIGKARFTSDTDEFVLNDQLLVLGIQAHWAQTKLLPQANDFYSNYMAKRRDEISDSVGTGIAGGVCYSPNLSPYTNLWK